MPMNMPTTPLTGDAPSTFGWANTDLVQLFLTIGGGLLGVLGGALLSGVQLLLAAKKDQDALDLANAATLEDDIEVRRLLNEMEKTGVATAEEIGKIDIGRAIGDFNRALTNAGISSREFGQFVSEQKALYAGRTSKGMAMLKGAGAQERRDIASYYDSLLGKQRQSLKARGLGGTNVLESMGRGVGRERTADIGRLNERLRQQRFDAYRDLTGEELEVGGRLGEEALAKKETWRDRVAAAASGIPTAKAGALAGPQRARDLSTLLQVEHLQGLSHTYQPTTTTEDAINTMTAAAYEPPEEGTDWAGIGTQVATTAAEVAAIKFATATCLSADSEVITPVGPRKLSQIDVGDQVLAADEAYHEVVDLDCGAPHAERHGDYLMLRTDYHWIIATKDHVVGGKAMERWRAGEMIQPYNGGPELVKGVRECEPCISGDLKLDGADEYVCNGLVVRSMFSERDAQNEDRQHADTVAVAG